jgi:pimeloyl-ACP methyl ester carboxylesterase
LPGSGVTLGGTLWPRQHSEMLPAIIVLRVAQPGVRPARVEDTARRLRNKDTWRWRFRRGWPPSSGWDCGTRQPDDVAKAADWLAALLASMPTPSVFGVLSGRPVALLSALGAIESKPSSRTSRSPMFNAGGYDDCAGIRYFYVPLVCGTGSELQSMLNQIHAPVLLIHGDRDTESQPSRPGGCKKSCVELIARRVAGHRRRDHGFGGEQGEQAWSSARGFQDAPGISRVIA